MPAFGNASMGHLLTCVMPLRILAFKVVTKFDCSVVWGRRGKEAQDHAFKMGWTKKTWPNSVHNVEPPELSKAIDLVPFPIDWNDEPRLYYFSGYVRGIAEEMGIKLRYGADWDGDYNINDQVLRDPCHFEFVGE